MSFGLQKYKKNVKRMREQGTGLYTARDEIFAGKILKRINELVNKLESEDINK